MCLLICYNYYYNTFYLLSKYAWFLCFTFYLLKGLEKKGICWWGF